MVVVVVTLVVVVPVVTLVVVVPVVALVVVVPVVALVVVVPVVALVVVVGAGLELSKLPESCGSPSFPDLCHGGLGGGGLQSESRVRVLL